MATNQQCSQIRNSSWLAQWGTLALSTALLFYCSGSHAEGRESTIKEPSGTSTHYYSSPVNANTAAADKIKQAASTRQIRSHNNNFWIHQASINLNTDHDHDGHYSSFTLSLDVDTHLAASAVYAVLYLGLHNNNWIEYAVSSNFTVRGSGSYDMYTIEANLDSGYPSGYYDQHIEVYDAYSHEFLIGYGPENSYALQGLPIESGYHDNRFTLSSDLTFSFTGTGTLGLPLLLPLFSAWGYRRWTTKKARDLELE